MNHSSHPAPRRPWRGTGLAGALAALALVIAIATGPALATVTQSNTTPITFNSSGPAATYPSTIEVTGLSGSITRVTVALNNVGYDFFANLDVLLVGPGGQQVMLMSDAGGATNTFAAPIALTFADGAPPVPSAGVLAGTYRPTNVTTAGADTFPAPGPGVVSAGANTQLSVFNLTDPNGVWRLFVVEDSTGSTGTIGGWSLSIETADLAAEVAPAPASINAGETLTYNVTVSNRGTEDVAGPTVTIGIPTGTSYTGVTPQAGWDCAAPAAGATTFTCTTATFAHNTTATFAVSVLVDRALAPNTTLTRTAAINSAVPEAGTANNSASAPTNITTLANLAAASVDAPPSVNAGADLPIAVQVANAGPSNAANARVTIPVPAGATFVSLQAQPGWTCTSPAVGESGNVVCSVGVFSTETAAFTVVVKTDPALDSTATIQSSASITSDTADNVAGNNSGADSTTVGTQTDLAVSVSDSPDPVSASANLTYAIVVTNNGPSNAAAAQLATSVRVGTTFVALEAPAGWICTSPSVGDVGAVSCTNPSFGVTNATFRLTVRVLSGVPVGTTIPFEATVSTTTTDTNPANNQTTESSTVTVAADLSVRVEGETAVVRPGATLAYRIRANNGGPELAENVTVTTAVPQNTTLVSFQAPEGWSCTVPAVGTSGPISCTAASFDVEATNFDLVVRVGTPQQDITIAMTASISSPTQDGDPANNSEGLNTPVTIFIPHYLPLIRR